MNTMMPPAIDYEKIARVDEEIAWMRQMQDLLAECREERDGYHAACKQAEESVRLLREELDDVQRENVRLRGWQDCARELLGGSRSVAVK
jgi:hypothetical protein